MKMKRTLWIWVLALIAPVMSIAQVTDKPITKQPPADAVIDMQIRVGKGCAVWWERDGDRYGDYHLAKSALDVSQLVSVDAVQAALNKRDVAALTTERTKNVKDLADVLQPCMDKLEAPAQGAAWIVAPITSGKRPAYVLNSDGTRGAQQDTADTTISVDGKTGAMWCNCRVRSKETTSSTYCEWAMSPARPPVSLPVKLVTLCRENKPAS
jgi:hypothetical protein